MDNPKLIICIPTKEDIKAWTVACFIRVSAGCVIKTEKHDYIPVQRLLIGQSDIAKIRSRAITEWYRECKNEDDLFLFIDSDQTFEIADIIKAVDLHHQKNVEVVVGACSRSDNTITLDPVNLVDFTMTKQGPVYYSGAGFMLISYKAADMLAKKLEDNIELGIQSLDTIPYFMPQIVNDGKGQKRWLGEDYSFCHRVRDVGGTVYGFVSSTIGHIMPVVHVLDPENIIV